MRSLFAGFLAVFAFACGGTTAPTGATVTDGGTQGDGGTTQPTTACTGNCFPGGLSWGANGGLVAYSDSSRVESCTSYVHSRSDSSGSGGGDLSCTATLETACTQGLITTGDLDGALQAADVEAAFASYEPSKGPSVFGSDSRPCDGSLLEVAYRGKIVDIGGKCGEGCGGTQDTCVEVPSGLRALADLLNALDQQELKTPSCKSVFP